MKGQRLRLTLTCLLLISIPSYAGQNELLDAVKDNDAFLALRELRQGTDPNYRDANGKSTLEMAAEAGNFELCKFLLWHGAKPFDRNGASLAETLSQGHRALPKELSLLLRAYAFLDKVARPPATMQRPELAVVYEPIINYTHPDIEPRYYVNQKEKLGKPGVDDDGNGFVDDIYGWSTESDQPYQLSPLQLKIITRRRAQLDKWARLYNADRTRRMDDSEDPAWTALTDSYNNPLAEIFGNSPESSDQDYLMRFVDLSHGTHVAGIILKSSANKALVHTISWGAFASKAAYSLPSDVAANVDFDGLIPALEDQLRPVLTRKGQRGSDYLRTLGPGVVNASMSADFYFFRRQAVGIVNRFVYERKLDVDEDKREVKIAELAMELYAYRSIPHTIAGAENPNTLFVVAAGNYDEDNDDTLQAPAYFSRFFPNVITVAAADDSGRITEYSNYGRRSVNLGAPGNNILSSGFGITALYMSGTSMATPAVAGCAAKIRSSHPELSAATVRRILENSTRRGAGAWSRQTTSGGLLDQKCATRLADGDATTLADVARQLVARHTRESNPEALCDALDYSERAVARNSEDADIWWDRAIVLDAAGETAEALLAVDKGLAIAPNRPGLWRTRCQICMKLHRESDAVESINRFVTLLRNPNITEGGTLSDGLLQRARVFAYFDRNEEAKGDVQEFLKMKDKDLLPEDLANFE